MQDPKGEAGGSDFVAIHSLTKYSSRSTVALLSKLLIKKGLGLFMPAFVCLFTVKQLATDADESVVRKAAFSLPWLDVFWYWKISAYCS